MSKKSDDYDKKILNQIEKREDAINAFKKLLQKLETEQKAKSKDTKAKKAKN